MPAYMKTGYGLSEALPSIFPSPIKANRAPIFSDKNYQIGQVWVYSALNEVYILTSIVSNLANWQLLTSSGGSGVFASLLVAPGPISLTGTTTVNTTGASNTSIGSGSNTGSVTIGNSGNTAVSIVSPALSLDSSAAGSISVGASLTTGTISIGGTAQTGTLTIAGGTANQTVAIAAAGTGTKTINIGASGSSNAVSIGSITGGSSVLLNSGTAGVVLSNSTAYLQLQGPIRVYTGAGAPSGALALEIGDLYVNTTAASATTRMYIATAVGTWTNITCAA